MPDKNEPPRPPESPRKASAGRRLAADQYELKIRWEKARKVFEVSPQGVSFEFDNPLKVGLRYPISLSAPGVSFSSTLEVVRCQLTLEAEGRFFRIEGRFFPYVE
ncbi:MAG TPA: hypothetical protein VK780_05610 [Thermoanaerobaculia bacterium]|jgi:hypothetical protein|nr:hypothetical protein [Thermoanaerobaculia bacterium]